ncbi:hypothetical protein N7505_005632 [Penicillium chrysogenum]|uniref:Mitochondrial splicing suppressor 51-like C-terminal domain-containing protein n=1 Tax=Penicillium chrysogenum TaxID=5076 RepID=A0ABQ8WIL3_PENCH|nr:hypothetical protein N7505_005632 [Penicillium chrysogenum]
MAGYTCVQCLQVLRQGVRASAPQARLQSLATARRRSPISPSFIRSFGSQRNGRSLGNAPEQPKHTHNQTCCAPKSSPSPLTQRAAHTATGYSVNPRAVLKPDNLFHSFSNSPSPAIRKRAEFIKQNAFCPHPSHQQTRAAVSPHDPEARKTTDDTNLPPGPFALRINEDDHDLHSGRFFREFHYPGPQDDNFVINMTNWDTYLYTREFAAINDDRSMRQVTRMLTYPQTIGSVLHELSPYSVRSGGRLTPEGLKSLSALRYTLHPPKAGESIDVKGLRLKAPPVRIFILGARAESSLPRDVWLQLQYMYPRALLHLIFIGPESMANRDGEYPLPERTPENPFGGIVEDRLGGQMKITTYVDYFHTMNKAQYFGPFDPYLDCFMLFHPGLGHPASSHEWEETLPQLLETKVPIICTGYTQWDLERDINWVGEKCRGEFDVLLEPGENIFRSLRWDLNDQDPHDVSCGNWGLWAFRGKRYEAAFSKEE